MKYISAPTLVVTFLFSAIVQIEAQCAIPASVHGVWLDRYDANRNTWTTTIAASTTTWSKVPPTLFSPRLTCTSNTGTVATAFYYVTKVFRIEDCNEMKLRGNILLMRYKSVDQGPVTATNCSSVIPANEEYQPKVAYPIDYTGIQCPITDGAYQVTYSQSSSVKDQCSGDASSTATVSGNQIEINSCYSGAASYDKPYKVKLTCMGILDGADIDSDANGKVLLLSFNSTIDSKPMFYCARYKTDGSIFYMSLNVLDFKSWACAIGADYKKFDDTAAAKFRAFTFAGTPTTTAAPTTTKAPMTTTAAPTTTTKAPTTTTAPPTTTKAPMTTTAAPTTTTQAPTTAKAPTTQAPTTAKAPTTTKAPATTKTPTTKTVATTTTKVPTTTTAKITTQAPTTTKTPTTTTRTPTTAKKAPPTTTKAPVTTMKAKPMTTMSTKAKGTSVTKTPVSSPLPKTTGGPDITTKAEDNVCTMVKPCQNKASCKATGKDSYYCSCTDTFTGKNCTTPREKRKFGLKEDEVRIIMAMVILLAAIIVAVVIVSLVVCHFRQRVSKIPGKGRHINPDGTGYSATGSKSWYPDYMRS